jgi:hypothetical protein
VRWSCVGAVHNWAFGAPLGRALLPGLDVGDQLEGALDGGEGCAGVGPGGALVTEQCDQPPVPRSGCRAIAQGSTSYSAPLRGSSSLLV